MTDDIQTMTPDEIFAALVDYDYRLPEKALCAAESMPEIMAPLLLERLEQTLSNYDARPDEDERHWLTTPPDLSIKRITGRQTQWHT